MDYKIKEETLSDIADAIRSKSGSSETIKVSEFAEQIETIPTGSDIELIENLPIAVDFSQGNQFIEASEGQAVKSAVIQKPENLLPENIAEGINIAGIIGALTASGGSPIIKIGTFTGTGSVQTVEHGLGVIPDLVIIIRSSGALTSTYCLGMAFGVSSTSGIAIPNANGGTIGNAYMIERLSGSTKQGYSSNSSTTIDQTNNLTRIAAANDTTFQVGISGYNGLPGKDHIYAWLAIGGLTQGGG